MVQKIRATLKKQKDISELTTSSHYTANSEKLFYLKNVTCQICEYWINRSGRITGGNGASHSVQIQKYSVSFSGAYTKMKKFSSCWRNGRKVLEDQEKRISPLQVEKYSGIWTQ